LKLIRKDFSNEQIERKVERGYKINGLFTKLCSLSA
jgi:hypothetical protein